MNLGQERSPISILNSKIQEKRPYPKLGSFYEDYIVDLSFLF